MPASDIDLNTDIRSSILTQAPTGGRAILYMIVLLIILLLVWAYVSEVDEYTRGEGKVIPSQQVQVVQNLEGGIISEILVKVGDVVKKDQLMLRIDETRFSSTYQESRSKYLALKARAARLQAETTDTPFHIPEEITQEKTEIGIREKELYESRKKELETTLQILQEQINQRVQESRELAAKLRDLNSSYELIRKELDITKPLVAQGAVSEVEVLRLERQASEMKGAIEATRLAIPRADSRSKEAQRKIQEEKLAFHSKAKSELNNVLAELEGVSATSVALEDRLQRTSVRSPVHGTINQILVSTVGGVIQPGMNLIEIVPLDDSLLIEAKIRPSDIAFLRPNQKAMVKFTAYDFTIYGGLDAHLEHISADSITDDKGNSYYLVRLRTQKNYLGTIENPLPIIPGMVTAVDIITGKKTILNYLLKPILRARQMALRER